MPTAAKAPVVPFDATKVRLVERRLPWVGEPVSAVATAGFRSLTRAPEAKMSLLAPLIMVVVFGGVMASAGGDPPAELRPLIVFGASGMILFISGLQLLANQFGYDRAGFRAYVLSPLPRRDILLGKNLAVAPLLLGLGLMGFLVVGAVYPLRADYYPAALAQMLSTYLILCMLSNVLAILTPIPLAPGSLQPAKIKAGPVLMQMLVMMLLPLFLLPVLAPYGLEVLLDHLDVVKGIPISLPLSLVVLALVVSLYRFVIGRQGAWLMRREQKILEVVTSRAE
jgi:ABC-2 type transport system permease protein